MAISQANALNEIAEALATNSSRIVIDKASIAGQTANTFASLWRGTGQPGQGAIPTTAAVCSNALVGSIQFAQQTPPRTTYGAYAYASSGNSAMTPEIHDRLMHMGGLVGNVATSQTVGIDLSANLATSNLDARKGDANYSDVQWWLEWYTATGSTAVTATISALFDDGTSANLAAVSLAATRPASHMIPLNSYIQAAQSGHYIKGINSVQLSVTTGTAGNFGVTATKPRMTMPLNMSSKTEYFDWAALGIPEILNSSCLFPLVITSQTNTGSLRCGGKLAHI